MTEVAVEVTGEMDTPADLPKSSSLSRFLKFSKEMPDPKEWIQQQRQNVRPWLLFIQTSNFKAPASIPRLGKRIMRNIEYFQANYLFVFIGLIIYCLITSPMILIAIAGTFYAGYKLSLRYHEKKLVIFGKELTLAQQYGLVFACSMPIYYLVGAHAAMFWVIGASIVIITLHAAFYNIEAIIARQDDEFPLLEEV
ncbi:prenylated Rab acceptor protein 1 [Anthonomus grandis grandis]|uniref:prenylated Rab acceptor protein 1 n=1 Tax=Anthonomus grandis grandis TaxID=2921223 RepID=UPI002165A3FC|nr:prenylated Rab acceptor protein 1 [Anthonomus grandis grandis]